MNIYTYNLCSRYDSYKITTAKIIMKSYSDEERSVDDVNSV